MIGIHGAFTLSKGDKVCLQSGLNLRSTACGSVTFTSTGNEKNLEVLDVQKISSGCSLGVYTWIKLSVNGQVVWGASETGKIQLCTAPPPTGGKWLSSAGSFTIEKLDRTGRKSVVSHTNTVTKFLLHTIDGIYPRNGDWEIGTNTLDQHGYWPHFIVAKDKSGKMRIGQYLPLDQGGRALVTGNQDGVIQVEIGGNADRPFTNDAELTTAVKTLYRALRAAVPTIPNSIDNRVKFRGEDAYGVKAPQRLSKDIFRAINGLCGHQHVYSNDHWDPGQINPNVLLD